MSEDTDRTRRKDLLLQAGLALTAELSLDVVLRRIVELAIEITGARYGALAVLGPGGAVEEFVTVGVTREQRQSIGHPPVGRGILGVLVEDARPLRLDDISTDPRSVGFPPNHPPMRSFLGAPVKALGRVFGNVYLTEKQAADRFSDQDEEDLVVLATQAGIAVANAQLYEETRQRERWLDAVTEITTAMLSGDDAVRILAVVAARARELVEADLATIATPVEGSGDLTVTAVAGRGAERLRGVRFAQEGSLSGQVIGSGEPLVIEDVHAHGGVFQPLVNIAGAGPAILAPLLARGAAFGTLATANLTGGRAFDDREVRLVVSLAHQASLAFEYARAQEELHRLAVLEDRERIARELHDGAIQSLFAVGMGLQGATMLTRDEDLRMRIDSAVADLDRVVRDLRNYIFGLRPGILADRQLHQALRDLADDFQAKSGVTTVVDVDGAVAAELSPRAADVVQLTREALSNVSRHAHASTVRVSLRRRGHPHEGQVAVLEIDDDGRGFDPVASAMGNGLPNLRERVAAVGGQIQIESSPGEGTTVRVSLPIPG